MKNIFVFLAVASVVFSCSTQKGSNVKVPVILEIGDHKVPTEEFRYIYAKNNSKSKEAFTEKSLNDYMDLFVNFKLKVLEAERLQLDTVPSFVKELAGYRRQLAKPYMTESSVTENLVEEAYDRLKFEVNASHILVKVAEDAEPADTLKAFTKISDIRSKAIAGEDFGQLAVKHSDDPSAQGMNGMAGNKGNLGYFTAFSMVYPFESAAYETAVGEVSTPVRTKFGYHLLKVHDRRESKGEVKVAHIMVKAANGMEKEDSIQAKKKIDEIHERLLKGGDWDELCNQFSEHEPSKAHGGELQPFKLGGRLGAPKFEEVAFSLSKAGDISSPVKSSFGWHVVKLIEKLELKPFEALQSELERKVKRDSRSQLNYRALIERLKVEDNFVEYPEVVELAVAQVDSTYIKNLWTYKGDDELTKKILFKINKDVYKVSDFFDYLIKNSKVRAQSIDVGYVVKKMYGKYVDESIYNYEEVHLSDKFVDYRMLTKEYRDGILLFQLMDDKIWSRAAKDTVGLKAYFEANVSKYQWKERAEAKVYVLENAGELASLKEDVEAGLTNDELLAKYNKESALMLKIEEGVFEKGKNEVLDKVEWKVGVQQTEQGVVTITKVMPAEPKKISEIRGLVISDYQNHLEKEWILGLKKQKEIKINSSELKKLIK